VLINRATSTYGAGLCVIRVCVIMSSDRCVYVCVFSNNTVVARFCFCDRPHCTVNSVARSAQQDGELIYRARHLNVLGRRPFRARACPRSTFSVTMTTIDSKMSSCKRKTRHDRSNNPSDCFRRYRYDQPFVFIVKKL